MREHAGRIAVAIQESDFQGTEKGLRITISLYCRRSNLSKGGTNWKELVLGQQHMQQRRRVVSIQRPRLNSAPSCRR